MLKAGSYNILTLDNLKLRDVFIISKSLLPDMCFIIFQVLFQIIEGNNNLQLSLATRSFPTSLNFEASSGAIR